MPFLSWDNMTTTDFAGLDLAKAIAVLPVGSIEQHGPHLPLCVDACITAGVLDEMMRQQVPEGLTLLALPLLPVGKANEHSGFAGTLSLSVQTLMGLWTDVAESVFRAGLRKLMILNGHGGQSQVAEIVARDLRVRHNALVVPVNWWSVRPTPTLFPATEYIYGIHGGAEETSVMMHLRPDLVRRDACANFIPRSLQQREIFSALYGHGVRHAWQAEDLQETGACGDATLADATKGRAIIAEAAQSLLTLLQEMAAFELPAKMKT